MSKTELTKIYLVRHGESEANARAAKGEDGNAAVMFDAQDGAPLTEKGKKQAENLAIELRDIHFDAMFSSDLIRAKTTAEAVAMERNLTVQTTGLIRERELSRYAHKISKPKNQIRLEMQQELEALDEREKLAYKHSPEMESAEEAATRLITFLREIAVAYSGKTVLVANHGNLIRSTLSKLGWASFDELPDGTVDNTGYVVLESDGVDFFIQETHGIHKQDNGKRIW
jgi:broad specificity phosphatase PhoE